MRTGACLCGAVRYEVTGEPTRVTYCHCSRCRRWHGHIGAWIAVDRLGFRCVEDSGLKWYAYAAVKRGFCTECGSSVLWDEAGDPKLGVGTFDAPTGLTSNAHIFVASKGDYYELPDDGLVRRDEYK
jgi:hypothetical protein